VSDQIHQIVTDRMIAAPERGTIPWNAGLAHASAGPVLAHARTPAAGTRL
jgi:antirestriction protein ArdC